MNRSLRFSFSLAGIMAVAACADQPSRTNPTAPPTEPSFSDVTGFCTSAGFKLISDEIVALFPSNPQKKAAQDLAKAFKQDCPSATSQNNALVYIAFTIANKGTMDAARADAFVHHWDNVGVFVDLGEVEALSGSLLDNGAACVIPRSGGQCLTSPDIHAGVVQGILTEPVDPYNYRLYTLSPNLTTSCLATNLRQIFEFCYDFDIFPAAAPGQKYVPSLEVFICTVEDADVTNALYTIGHTLGNGQTRALKRTPDATSAYMEGVCEHSVPTAASAGIGSVFERFLATLSSPFRPRTLSAANGGLGIEDHFAEGTSPLGGVDLRTFADDFNANDIGTTPVSPQVGQNWVAVAEPPGSITVESSLGTLTDKPVVLRQALGACGVCPELRFIGTMANVSSTVRADEGSYVIKLDMVQDRPSVTDAPLIIRSFDDLEIARLSYSTETSARVLRYNGDVVGTWTTSVHQSFEITVNIDNKTTTLSINGGTGVTKSFVNNAAADLARIAWIFGGIDAGLVGVDNITITRNIDQ
jgi:hypothetical protein